MSDVLLGCVWKGEAASLADRYGMVFGLPMSTAILFKKQIQYRYSHGIGAFKYQVVVNLCLN